MEFKSKWICAKEFAQLKPIDVFHKQIIEVELPKTPENLINSHWYFRKSFVATAGDKYIVNISADDFYKLYVNGHFVCQGPGAGYAEKYYYNTADISEYINDGDNVIAVHTYYHGHINRVVNSGDNRFGLISDVYCNDEFAFGTDSTWRYNRATEYVAGHLTGYETQYMENIDFNLVQKGWNDIGFDDGAYESAVEKVDDDHIFIDCVPCLEVYDVLPKEVVNLGDGHYFIDFGKEYTGQIHFVANGKQGEKVKILCGEELADEHSVRYEMRCNCIYETVCTLSGGEDEALFYDYMTFRYAELISESDCIDIDSVYMIVRHHPFDDEASSFDSNNQLLEDIWDICAHGVKIGTQEFYLDCPSREKGQYLGDFMVTGLSHMYLTGDWQMYRKTLMEYAYSSKVCPGIMACAPGSYMQEIADFSLLYPYMVYNYYKYTNDIDTLKELMPYVENLVKYFDMYKRPDGLLEGVYEKWNLVDWPTNLRDDYDFELPGRSLNYGCHNAVNAYYYIALIYRDELRKILGIDFESDADMVKESYIREFYKSDVKLFTDTKESAHASIHSNALPAFAGLVPDEAIETVRQHIMDKGLCCGVWFAYFVLKGLAKIGAYEDEYKLIVNESIHSWANMLREGATSCYEAWGKEQKWNASLCHPWASSPIIAIIEDILGVDKDTFATGVVKCEPHIPAGVTFDVTLPTMKDKINIKY